MRLRPGLVRRVLLVCGAAVCATGFAVELLHFTYGPMLVTSRFSLSYETNVPTWYKSFLLLGCAASLAFIAAVERARAGRWRREWTLLSVIFLVMSVDEVACLHELFNGYGKFTGALFYAWVIPATVVVLILAARFLPFVLAMPRPLRGRTIVAGAIYVGGALGVEPILGIWATGHGEMNLVYHMVNGVEETMQILGSSLFLVALVDVVAGLGAGLEVTADPR